MASTVINDPEAIQAYRQQIADKVVQLKELLVNTDRSLETVSESWKDNNFTQFRERFNEDKEQIKPLFQALDTYDTEVLYHLQKKLETYQGGRMYL